MASREANEPSAPSRTDRRAARNPHLTGSMPPHGYRRGFQILLGRELPEGPKWGSAIPVCLFWLVIVQAGTGLLMMTTYSPSLTTAWASVHFIDRDPAGAFLRGVHHYAAQMMIAILFVHLIRVLFRAAFQAPRELVWITGVLLIPLMLAWAITGNPLSGSQQGMAQIDVEGNIVLRDTNHRTDSASHAHRWRSSGQPDAHAPLFPSRCSSAPSRGRLAGHSRLAGASARFVACADPGTTAGASNLLAVPDRAKHDCLDGSTRSDCRVGQIRRCFSRDAGRPGI